MHVNIDLIIDGLSIPSKDFEVEMLIAIKVKMDSKFAKSPRK